MMGRRGLESYQESTYSSVEYIIPANNSDGFSLTYDYLMIESISDSTITELQATVDGMKTVTLAVGMKIRFNQMQNILRLKNPSGSAITVKVGFGIGDIEDYRLFGNVNSNVIPEWGAAYSDVLMRAAGDVGMVHYENSFLTPTGSTQINGLLTSDQMPYRIVRATIAEITGTPGAVIHLARINSGSTPQSWDVILTCYAGQTKDLPFPILQNMNNAGQNKLYAIYDNNAAGHVHVSINYGSGILPTGAKDL